MISVGDFSGAPGAGDLEERIARLEDLEAIRNLKARYAQYCDANYDPDGIASLFVEDGVWETSQPESSYRSREEIRAFFTEVSKTFIWALHFMICPVIELASDRRSATATWYMLGPMTMQDAGKEPDAVLTTGIYDDAMVKTDEGWRFSKMRINIEQMSNLDEGWVRQRFRP